MMRGEVFEGCNFLCRLPSQLACPSWWVDCKHESVVSLKDWIDYSTLVCILCMHCPKVALPERLFWCRLRVFLLCVCVFTQYVPFPSHRSRIAKSISWTEYPTPCVPTAVVESKAYLPAQSNRPDILGHTPRAPVEK
jgi:hypothetical protein